MALGTIGFRPNEEDQRIIEAAAASEDLSTAEVIRRALRLLDRDMWQNQANTDARRLENEDLSGEPDDWV